MTDKICFDSVVPAERPGPFGVFEDQTILGTPCTIRVSPLEDSELCTTDILGCVMLRGQLAIHVSGLDPFGKPTGPGRVREIGWYEVDWLGRREHPSGFGCKQAEAAVLVDWPAVNGDESRWKHHGFWSPSHAFVTLLGIYSMTGLRDNVSFDVASVCSAIDRCHRLTYWRPHYTPLLGNKKYERAVRRLLEAAVGREDECDRLIDAVLCRRGRWRYRFRPADVVAAERQDPRRPLITGGLR